jgi:hypothetical protein
MLLSEQSEPEKSYGSKEELNMNYFHKLRVLRMLTLMPQYHVPLRYVKIS